MNLPPQQRLSTYIDSNYDNIQEKLVSFASDISYMIGFDTFDISLPLIRYLAGFNILNLFLGNKSNYYFFFFEIKTQLFKG